MIRSVIYTILGGAFTLATSWSLGALLLRRLRVVLHAVEEQLLALFIGSIGLGAVVFCLCSAGGARKSVFLVFGLLVNAISLGTGLHRSLPKFPPLPRRWKAMFLVAFAAMSVMYIAVATPPQLNHDALMYRLSLIGQAHGFVSGTDATLTSGTGLVFLYAVVITRYSAAVLVNALLLAALVLLVLCYWRRAGYPLAGVVAALLTCLAAFAGKHDSLAFTHFPTILLLFAPLYILQAWNLRVWVLGLGIAALAYSARMTDSIGFVPIVPFASLMIGLVLSDLTGFKSLLRKLAAVLSAGVAMASKVPWYAWIGLLVISPWVASFLAPAATVKSYFWVEQHWLSDGQKEAMKDGVPMLCRFGLLCPVRLDVEPGISFRLDPRDLVSVSILRGGSWQPEIWDSLSPSLSEGGVFMDVGAHIGYFSIKAAQRVGKTGQVISFEPNPETITLLRENILANHATNVILEPIACTDREQTLTLWAAPVFNTGASSLSRENADLTSKEPPRPYQVRGRPIDDVVRELQLTRVDAIKIDVEGAEVYVLRGTVETLKRFHPKVVIEVEERQLASMQTTPEELIAILRDAGYNHSTPVGPTDWEWTVVNHAAEPAAGTTTSPTAETPPHNPDHK